MGGVESAMWMWSFFICFYTWFTLTIFLLKEPLLTSFTLFRSFTLVCYEITAIVDVHCYAIRISWSLLNLLKDINHLIKENQSIFDTKIKCKINFRRRSRVINMIWLFHNLKYLLKYFCINGYPVKSSKNIVQWCEVGLNCVKIIFKIMMFDKVIDWAVKA